MMDCFQKLWRGKIYIVLKNKGEFKGWLKKFFPNFVPYSNLKNFYKNIFKKILWGQSHNGSTPFGVTYIPRNFYTMEKQPLKSVNNCLNTNIYSYLETSVTNVT